MEEFGNADTRGIVPWEEDKSFPSIEELRPSLGCPNGPDGRNKIHPSFGRPVRDASLANFKEHLHSSSHLLPAWVCSYNMAQSPGDSVELVVLEREAY